VPARAEPLSDRVVARRTLSLAGMGHAAAHSWELVFPAVAVPMALDMGLPYAHVVTLSFLCYLLYGLGALPSGWATDRFGGRPVLLSCLIGGGLCGCLVALSTGKVGLILSLGGLGLAASLYHPAGLALLSRQFHGTMGRAFAINGIAGNVGITLTPLLAGLVTSLLGWRWAYAILCGPALVAGIVFLLLPFPERSGTDDGPAATASRPLALRWTPLLLLGMAVAFAGLAYRLHTLVLPALIQERLPDVTAWAAAHAPSFLDNVENLAATALTTVAYALGMAGQWFGGRVADRRALAPAYAAFHAAGLPLVLLAAVAGGPMLIVLLVGFLFFNQGMQPIENRLVASLIPPAFRGRAFAGKFVLAFGVGSGGVWLVALVIPLAGLGGPFLTAGGFELLIVLVALWLWRATRLRA
jgi:MFS family permease